MKVAIVYGSRSGNTRRIAAAISDALSGEAEVELMEAETARIGAGTDLLIVGGPTEGHSFTPPVRAFLDRVGSLAGTDRKSVG